MFWGVKFAVRAMMPRYGATPGVAELGLSSYLREFLSETTWLTWFGLMLASFVFMISPLITVGWPVPAAFLPAAVLDKHAHRLATSRVYLVRQSTFIIKMVAGFCWGSHAKTRAQFHLEPYPGDPATWRQT
jgi:hypothetical protein